MKKCPKCFKLYNDNWEVCLGDTTQLIQVPEEESQKYKNTAEKKTMLNKDISPRMQKIAKKRSKGITIFGVYYIGNPLMKLPGKSNILDKICVSSL